MFDGKADEGFFVGYSLNSKAFRVFSNRTRIVEENLHVRFNENTPNIARSGPNWLFDIEELTMLMNYKPVIRKNQSNGNAGTKACDDADDGFQPSSDDGKKVDENSRQESECKDQDKEDNVKSTNNANVAGAKGDNVVRENINNELPFGPEMLELEDISTFNFSNKDENDGVEADMNNLDSAIQVSATPITRIHKDHPFDQVIGDSHSTTQTRKMSKNLEEHRKIEEEVYVCQPSEFQDPDFLNKVYKVKKALHGLHQAPRPTESEGFEQITDFLNAHSIKYALTVNPTICTSCIEQFWDAVKVKNINREVQLHAKVDGKKVVISEASIRKIFSLEMKEELIVYPMSTIASAVICLVTYQKFNFSKYIFESMVKNLDSVTKFLMYPKFVQPGKTKRKDTQVSQFSVPTESVADEAINEDMDDRLVRAVNTASSLEAEQDSGNIAKTKTKETPNESSSQGTDSSGGPKRQDTMEDANRVLALEATKTTQAHEIDSLKRRVKKLKKKQRSRTHKLKRLYKVGLSARAKSSDDEGLEMFDADKDLQGDEVVVEQEVVADKEPIVDDAQVSASATTITIDYITLAKALEALKTSKPKIRGIVIKDHKEPSESRTTTINSSKKSQDKDKAKMIEEPVKLKTKDQILFDEKVARKLQEKINEEDRLVGEKARQEEEANIELIET
nr:ribonuclease H-like domain-containing protein [Tanacetum cinerariifolium]